MGWKTLKEHFDIEHFVQVTKKGICIGSGFVHDLVTIDPKTGALQENQTFHGLIREKYPALLKATPQEIVALIAAPDTFAASIPVYTYDGIKIIEKQCEIVGWPNVTHDGCMMYENSFSTDKAQVIAWAKRNTASAIECTCNRIEEFEQELLTLKQRLAGYEAEQIELEVAHPTTEQV